MANEAPGAKTSMSFREFGRRIGVSHAAVSKAKDRGRLKDSIGVDADGKVCIVDFEKACQEWGANASRLNLVTTVTTPVTTPVTTTAPSPEPPAAPVVPAADIVPPVPAGVGAMDTLGAAAAEEKRWKARQAELDYRREVGEMVNAQGATALIVDEIVLAKTALLAIPSKAKALIAHLTLAEVRVLEDLIRQALEGLSKHEPADQAKGAAA